MFNSLSFGNLLLYAFHNQFLEIPCDILILFFQEEKEKRLEEMLESGGESLNDRNFMSKDNLPGEGMVGLVGKMTKETLTAADLIIDSLDMAEEELKRMDQYKVF